MDAFSIFNCFEELSNAIDRALLLESTPKYAILSFLVNLDKLDIILMS